MWPDELSCVTPTHLPHPAETVIIARKHNVPSLLKRAFYELLRTEGLAKVNLLPEGHTSPEGSDIIGCAKLSDADLLRLLDGREKLGLAWVSFAGSAPTDALEPCPLQTPGLGSQNNVHDPETTERDRCAEAWRNNVLIWSEKVIGSGFLKQWMLDPICGLERLADLDWSDAGFCESCVGARQELCQRKREEIWENMDTWFGL
ncbi:hypothetical protein BDY19DRAFT_895481 [Irpex rosettiformis]|uniref:Uncharacterized protein n=1 Tax=Irpex rosettiformis TaxID=378272 RepID=A0ACB8TVE3_9APHY|nr:hypothetical protein BDY19DRAFT_895481 [Irpex rosettiformis]